MKQKITASVVAKLQCPAEKGQAWVRDTEVSGFAVRITNKGIKSFVFEKLLKNKGLNTLVGDSHRKTRHLSVPHPRLPFFSWALKLGNYRCCYFLFHHTPSIIKVWGCQAAVSTLCLQ